MTRSCWEPGLKICKHQNRNGETKEPDRGALTEPHRSAVPKLSRRDVVATFALSLVASQLSGVCDLPAFAAAPKRGDRREHELPIVEANA